MHTMSLYFYSIFSQTSLFGAHRHIAAPAGFATFHASTCEVKSPNIRPSHDITAIIVYNKAYTILRHNSSFCPVYRHIVLYDGAHGRPGHARMRRRVTGWLVNFGDSHALWCVMSAGVRQGRRAGASWTQTGRWHLQKPESFDSRHSRGLLCLFACTHRSGPGHAPLSARRLFPRHHHLHLELLDGTTIPMPTVGFGRRGLHSIPKIDPAIVHIVGSY